MGLHLLFDIRRGFDLAGVAHLDQHEAAQIFHDLASQGAGISSRV